MRKSPAVRWLALGLAFWLSLVQSDAGVFHACESARPPEAVATVAMVADASADMHAHHAVHAAPGDDHASAAQVAQHTQNTQHANHTTHGDGECHCLGHCCPISVPDIPDADVLTLVSMRRLSTTKPGRADHAVMASWVDFVLPFSTAPPVVIDA